MPKGCILPFCKTRESTIGISFYRISESRRHLWLPALGRNINDPISIHNVICSLHFSPESFLPNQTLKKDAIPTLNLRPKGATLVSWGPRLQLRFSKKDVQVQSTLTTPQTTTERLQVMSVTDIPSASFAYSSNILEDKTDRISVVSTDSIFDTMPHLSTSLMSSGSCVLQGTLTDRQRSLHLDHSYYWSPRKMKKFASKKTEAVKPTLKFKLKISRRRIPRFRIKIKTLNGLVSHLGIRKYITDEVKD